MPIDQTVAMDSLLVVKEALEESKSGWLSGCDTGGEGLKEREVSVAGRLGWLLPYLCKIRKALFVLFSSPAPLPSLLPLFFHHTNCL